MLNETKDKPIKLQNNFYLYSGDIITISNSKPLLIEVIDGQNQTVKLRSIKKNIFFPKNNYLSRDKTKFYDKSALNFSTDFKNTLIFTVKKNDDNEISLQTNSEYLTINSKSFHLSSEEKWLTVAKSKIIEKIADYEQIVTINPHKEKEIRVERLLIRCESHDNKKDEESKHTFEFNEEKQIEHSLICSTDFTLGVSTNLKLNFSSIIGIDIGGRLEEKFCTSSSVKENEKTVIVEKHEVNCPPWMKVKVKLEAERIKTPYIAKIERIIGDKTYKYLIGGEYSRDDYSNRYWSEKAITVRNILIVGWTGSGKSTLANVLSKSDKFKISGSALSETKFFQKSKEFEWKGNYYCVIDNIGFGDTNLSDKDVLERIGKAISSTYQGISHVLLVFDERFSNKVKEISRKLIALKFTEDYITVVKSKFDNFRTKKEREEDRKRMIGESPEVEQFLNKCRGFLHVSNDDKVSKKFSREIVLNHLDSSCEDKPFKPDEWRNISSLIEEYFEKEERLEIKQRIVNLVENNEVFQTAQIVQETNR